MKNIPRRWLGGMLALLLAGNAAAQDVIPSAPQEPLIAPVLRTYNPSEASTAVAGGQDNGPTTFSLGEFHLHPHLLASYIHADGLPIGPGERVTSDIYTFAPGLLADLGENWTLDYTATALDYSSSLLRNTVNQDARVTGAHKATDWSWLVTGGYSQSSTILAETAEQTKQTVWSGSLMVDHDISNRLHYQGTGGVTDTNTENFSESVDWVTKQFLLLKATPKVEAGAGVEFGYSAISAKPTGPDSYYESYLGALNWEPTDKIKVALQAGWQDWHSYSQAIGSEQNPTIQGTLNYQPFEQTKITVTDSRTSANAIQGDAVTDTTGWTVGLNQQLIEKLSLDVSYSHETSDYQAGSVNPLAGRRDDVQSFNATLSVQVLKYWTVAALYQTSKNDSTDATYTYSSNQYGLELRAKF